MAKKKNTIFLSILFLIVVIGIGIVYFNNTTTPGKVLAVFSKSACVMIPNPNSPGTSYTETTPNTTYKCSGADECIVWGSMTVAKKTGSDVVAFRYNGNYESDIYVDSDSHGYLTKWSFLGKSTTYPIPSSAIVLPVTTPSGLAIYKYQSTYLYIMVGSTRYKYDTPTSGSYSLESQYGGCPNANEKCATSSAYSAYFNFQPTLNFAYGQGGSKNYVSNPTTVLTYFTNAEPNSPDGEYTLARDGIVTFTPKYPDGTDVIDKTIFIKKGDCTCANPAVACDTTKYFCNQCPPTYPYFRTGGVMCKNFNYQTFYNICADSGMTYPNCAEPYTTYKKCDGTHAVGQYGGSCLWWNTIVNCDTGMKCVADATGQPGAGIGACQCVNDPCGVGDIQVDSNNPTQFKRCTKQGSCMNWETSWQICPQGLVFDSVTKKCICDSATSCNYNSMSCVNSFSYKKCINIAINDNIFSRQVTCPVWGTVTSCLDNTMTCNSAIGTCDCSKAECSLGQVKCDGVTKYFDCVKENTECPKWSATSKNVPEYSECVDNQLQEKNICENTGCTDADRVCVNTQCVCKTGTPYCNLNSSDTCSTDNTAIVRCVQQLSGCAKLESTPVPPHHTCVNGESKCLTTGNYCLRGTSPICNPLDNTKIISCTQIQPNNDCYEKTETTVSPDKICVDGIETCKTSGGDYCAAGAPSKCSTDNTKRGVCTQVGDCYKYVYTLVPQNQVCVGGQLQCITTGDYCTKAQSDASTSKCVSGDSTHRYVCKPDTTVAGCYKWMAEECASNSICQNNNCGVIGCSYPSISPPSYLCDDGAGGRPNNYEQCSSNTCVCLQDSNTATEADFIDAQDNGADTRCVNNTPQHVQKYTGAHLNCYRWVNDDPCGMEEVCIKQSPAQCMPTYNIAGIILNKTEYAVGEAIGMITIDVRPTYNNGQNSNVPMIIFVYDGTDLTKPSVETVTNAVTNSQGKAYPILTYASPRVGAITIKAVLDPTGVNFVITKTLEVKKTLEIKLSCPANGVVNRDIKCTYKVTDKADGTIIPIIPVMTVTQGGSNIVYVITSTDITFKSGSIGNIEVSATVAKEGYISSSAKLTVTNEKSEMSVDLLVNNQDVYTLIQSGIDIGSKEIKLTIAESGIPASVNKIDATITTSTGQIVPLNFQKVSTGVYRTTYNFAEAGKTYVFKASVLLDDYTKEVPPIEYSISTAKSQTEDTTNMLMISIIGGAIGFILFLVFLVWLVRRKK